MESDSLNVKINYLNLYRGKSCEIPNSSIEIHVPTLDQICEYGESEYYSMVHMLCSVGIDLCWQLDEMGINFEEISDYELFYSFLIKGYSTKETSILFGNKLNFKRMLLYKNPDDDSIYLGQKYLVSVPLFSDLINGIVLYQIPTGEEIIIIEDKKTDGYMKIQYKEYVGYIMPIYVSCNDNKYYISETENPEIIGNGVYEDIIIDEEIYYQIVAYLRAMHNLKRDDRIAGSRRCRRAFIEDAKMEYEAAKLEPKKSVLLPMISTMVNSKGFKRNDSTVWEMNIYAFMDSVKRLQKIKNATLLLQSGYSGFGIDLKKIKHDEIDYMGELN